ncbi:hypothetical protein [Actinomadura sp. WMMB 499]|uniref:hypothetical protein n=1 Tax=Actinomadura sp. WMMB 499 TaxID=1219491 RepID=UPI00159D5ACB|nr:hypothetical protein [Actinomadura sp. WMMB 499]
MNNVANPPPPPDDGGRWRLAWNVTVRRVGLLADLGLALVELGRASRLLLEGNGQVVLSVPGDGGFAQVIVVQDGGGRWAYVWGLSAYFPAGVGADGTRRAASALAGGVG